MIVEIKELNGHWVLTKDGDAARAFVLNARDDESSVKLLAFLGILDRDRNRPVLRAGVFDLATMEKSADSPDLGSGASNDACGFESRSWHDTRCIA